MTNADDRLIAIDASKFQTQLVALAETMAQKVQREVPTLIAGPGFVPTDLFVMIRQAMYTYQLLCYINADERRESDSAWRQAYTFVTLPLIRTMVDGLYNITFILLDLPVNGRKFRLAGFKKELHDLKEDETKYAGQQIWDDYNKQKKDTLDLAIRSSGLTLAEVQASEPKKTMGKYLADKGPAGILTPHQMFLKTFTHLMWREYSAISHGGFEGLLDIAMYFTQDAQRHEFRPQIDEAYPREMTLHMMRASLVLFCIVTELQLKFRFTDANINDRLAEIWRAMMPAFETKEIYDEHYAALLPKIGVVI